jgi:1,4-dihydroxy-2-naphthoate polyprenyltransferase
MSGGDASARPSGGGGDAAASTPAAGLRVWVAGARPRTLGAAVCPVLVGTAAAAASGPVTWWRLGAALVVAVALQVGVNYANDYSDGVRGTDTKARIGPARLVATGLASPGSVRLAAVLAFGVAAVAGLALAIAVDLRLLLVGAAAIVAAVLYTGGPRPYGYSGLGEVSVMAFFGLVATCGSAYVQLGRIPWLAVGASIPVGLLAVEILLANNIRDLEGDERAGKRTLVVRLGPARGRLLFGVLMGLTFVAVIAIGAARPSAWISLLAAPLAVEPTRLVLERDDGPSLIRALVTTARLQLALAVLLTLGLWFA